MEMSATAADGLLHNRISRASPVRSIRPELEARLILTMSLRSTTGASSAASASGTAEHPAADGRPRLLLREAPTEDEDKREPSTRTEAEAEAEARGGPPLSWMRLKAAAGPGVSGRPSRR